MKKKLIIFLDSGDTLIDESSEQRDDRGIVQRAQLIPGAGETVHALYQQGYTLALVADGEWESFVNMHRQSGLWDLFAAYSVSERVGAQKPAAIMFQTAMDALGLGERDKARIIMVGNNLRKDIAGANRFGITSVLLSWSPRYNMVPAGPEEAADYVIQTPGELLALARQLEAGL